MANYAIIRMEKFKISDVQRIKKHNQRQGKSKSNLDIDYERSHLNVDLLNEQNLQYERLIKDEISERVKRKPRANSVVLSEFLVTASPDYMQSLSEEEQKRYFERSLDFIKERYGEQNTLYAVIHQDEANPIIRKDAEGSSYAKKYDKSPITTSYESLWKELVELKDSSANIIQNVMRKILENYFKIHGGIELNDLLDYFDEDQKPIVSSLIKWTHDGSHHIQEDLYVQQPSEMNDKYFGVFTQIFQESGNSGHLEMMIEKCVTKEDENPFKLFKKAV